MLVLMRRILAAALCEPVSMWGGRGVMVGAEGLWSHTDALLGCATSRQGIIAGQSQPTGLDSAASRARLFRHDIVQWLKLREDVVEGRAPAVNGHSIPGPECSTNLK